ncbi:MAG: HAMP domain-containing histidine kinase [Rhodocyclaceae bacterium]|nr:HAMP domain-containing histidine kinase [Rhodocyclaceae bacterium]
MSAPLFRDDPRLSETYWKSLRYFNLYRFILAALLFAASAGTSLQPTVFNISPSRWHVLLIGGYLLLTAVSVVSMDRFRRYFDLQLSIHILFDIALLTTLMYADGSLRSDFGWLLLVSLTGAGLVGQGRLVLFYAATATLAVLLSESYFALGNGFEDAHFLQAGLLSLGFFATAISGWLLARRIRANEELARQRGVALHNQVLVSQRVIEEMQDGVLVVGRDAVVHQHNPRAEFLLGLLGPAAGALADYSPRLAADFAAWQSGGAAESDPFPVAASGLTLRARFVPTASGGDDALVFLEDMGRVQQRAQQLKLAALGRLTANIAHEIRNPLSAISHASELLMEERRGGAEDRLLTIVRDNTRRLDRIVRNVLELGRRDRAQREAVDLAALLLQCREELALREALPAEVVSLECDGAAHICFDRSHLHQVLSNLLGNALRHSRRQPGSIVVRVRNGRSGRLVELHVVDDGEGVPADLREQIFEPFFTTHSRGTGLGLYIARELCEANGARLELLDNAPGGHFRITGGSDCGIQ